MSTNKKNQKHSWLFFRICLYISTLLLSFAIGVITGRSGFASKNPESSQPFDETPKDTIENTADSETFFTPDADNDMSDEIETMLNHMTLEEKVAQMFMITPESLTGVGTVIAAGDTTREAINQYPVGGLIYFSQNFRTPEQTKTMLANVQQYSQDRIGLPMFINVDEEGGLVTRFGNNSSFTFEKIENMRTIGDSGDTENAYDVGVKIGRFLSDLGFNMDNAPVADVLSNEANTVIGNRSFGTNSKIVSEMALAELNGLANQDIIGVYKHFPGHGATEADTHEGYAYTNATLEEMMQNDLIPFIDGVKNGIDVIMVSHIACPNVTGDDTPASLSSVMMTEVLKNQLGFEGIVITDSLSMGAIVNQYSSAEAAVKAVDAGADILLMPADFQAAYEGLIQAVQNGTISEDRIDASVRRIISLKQNM